MRNYEKLSNTFGGKIYNNDYDVYMSMADVASRIASDMRFDEQCRKACENRDRKYAQRKAGIK